MLWKLVDVVAILAAVGLLLLLGPTVIGMNKWRQLLKRRTDDENPS